MYLVVCFALFRADMDGVPECDGDGIIRRTIAYSAEMAPVLREYAEILAFFAETAGVSVYEREIRCDPILPEWSFPP